MFYPYQEACIEFHLQHHYSINACEPGLGKTRIALETAKRAGYNVAVFGPAFLKSVWEAESELIGGPRVEYFSYSTLHKIKPHELSLLRFWVAEECHFLKNPEAQRTQAFYTLLKRFEPDYFLGLTGTPIRNRVPDLWTLFAFCTVNPRKTSGLSLSGSLVGYHAFARHFCYARTMNISGRKIVKYDGLKEERKEELKDLLRNKYTRYRVEDVLDDLPELTRKEVYIPVGEYVEDIKGSFDAFLNGGSASPEAKASNALLKAPVTVDYCLELMEAEAGPLVIFTDHVMSAKTISKGVKNSALITGSTPMEERQKLVRMFQAGQIPAIVATIGSLAVGVTLTAARHIVFNDLSWTPSDNAQAEKRIHRIGQKNACFAHYMVGSETDRYINRTLFKKSETISKVIEG